MQIIFKDILSLAKTRYLFEKVTVEKKDILKHSINQKGMSRKLSVVIIIQQYWCNSWHARFAEAFEGPCFLTPQKDYIIKMVSKEDKP